MTNDEIIKILHPAIQPMVTKFLQVASSAGYNLRITDGYRTPERQQELYDQGRTKPGRIVTNAKGVPVAQSIHCFQLAIDVVDAKNGYEIDWEKLGKIGEDCGLEWGGRWSQIIDKPHFQFTGGLTLKQIQAGQRPGLPTQIDDEFAVKWSGKFILDVEDKGRVYYVFNNKRYYVSPNESLESFAKKFATGFKNKDVLRIAQG